MKDFKKVLQYATGEGKEAFSAEYGRISTASTGAILRKVIELEQQGADLFFGEKSFDVNDLTRVDSEGRGFISIIRLTDIQDRPKLFSTFMLSLLAEIYNTFPELGDPERPELVLFIDEAHLIFKEASRALLEQIESIVKLIRSKGVGVYFVTQNPTDVPNEVLAQLGLKVQHALRAFTARDRKAIKLTAENYPESEFYDTKEVLTSLGIGEALVSALDEKGRPTPLAATLMRAPMSRMDILTDAELAEFAAGPDQYRGAVALMWSHPRGALFEALDRAGVRAVISFNARERYLDPDQVVYARGGYGQGENLTLGMTVSWRQWSELLEDVQSGADLQVRARAVIQEYPNRFETVYAWIPGTEPELPGVVFTAHLFEGYTKRGANDNMGGPAIQLEILRALHDLIEAGTLPQPRRTIHFIWPNEISGTYELLRRNPELVDRLAININMDMVSEALRKNNGLFTMSETPAHLPSFYDGLAASVLNYVWRTNDIVYLPDSPRGRPGGQYFPRPLWEKNGTRDAFRFFIHEATGGSDHLVFNNPSVGVPGIEFFTWPDQWYHADKDLPENGDPTEMRRVAFIGATTAWVSANLQDDMLPDLLDAVSEFGYARVAERGLPRGLSAVKTDPSPAGVTRGLNIVKSAVAREVEALTSIREIYTGSPQAKGVVDREVQTWQAYGDALEDVVLQTSESLGGPGQAPEPSSQEMAARQPVPTLAPGIRGQEFYLSRFDRMETYLREHPDAVDDLGLSRNQTTQILNFINGRRSLGEIRDCVAAWTGEPLTVEQVRGYLDILEAVGWVVVESP